MSEFREVITRFAPSPTGRLHVGNVRAALINWLYSKKLGGKFLLRFDDTDAMRSSDEYKNEIIKDLHWLGLDWDQMITQSSRLERYAEVSKQLIADGKLYPCFETTQELEIKRKLQLANKKPPIYDRASLALSRQQIEEYAAKSRRPHYRFRIDAESIEWQDMIKGHVKYIGQCLGDPIVIREDGSMTYMLCSVIDDIDYKITDIIRGEDHITNTALQIEMFNALGSTIPNFGHLSLIKAENEKISKRVGGFTITSLRDEYGFEASAVSSFFSTIGSSNPVIPCKNLYSLLNQFDIKCFSKSSTTYMPIELKRLNHKLLINLSYDEVRERLYSMGLQTIDEKLWLAVRPNLSTLEEIKIWWQILYDVKLVSNLDKELLKAAKAVFPDDNCIDHNTWLKWIKSLSETTKKRGKDLLLPLRLALTGMDHGPELKNILPLLSRDEIIKRLTSYV